MKKNQILYRHQDMIAGGIAEQKSKLTSPVALF